MSLLRLRHELRTSIWLVPLLCLFAFLALAVVTLAIDRANDFKLIGQNLLGSPTAVQQILATAASSVLSLATVVLSLTLVAVQLAMGQFSPRIVRALLEDRRSQLGIGLFLGTFVYTMAVLRDIDDQSGQMPGLSVLLSYVLIVASVAGLVLFVHYAGQSIRVAGLIDLVGDTTRRELERLYPRETADAPGRDDPDVIAAPESGNVIRLNEDGLVALAQEEDCKLEMLHTMGAFVACGEPLLRVHGTMERRDEGARPGAPGSRADSPGRPLLRRAQAGGHRRARRRVVSVRRPHHDRAGTRPDSRLLPSVGRPRVPHRAPP